MDSRTLHCLRGHEWEITLTVTPGNREMAEERTCPDEDLICAECGLTGYEGKPDTAHYREVEAQLRYCQMCERIYNPATGATEDFDVEPAPRVCGRCMRRVAA